MAKSTTDPRVTRTGHVWAILDEVRSRRFKPNQDLPRRSSVLLPIAVSLACTLAACGRGGDAANIAQLAPGLASAPAPAPAPPPAKPTGLIASAGAGQVNLVWSASKGAITYNVKRASVDPAVFQGISSVPFSNLQTGVVGTAFSDNSAVEGQHYIYQVTAVGEGGESAGSTYSCGSPAASGSTVPVVRPRVFMSMHGSNGVAMADAAVDAQWSYVRTCLDGIWANYAKINPTAQYALWSKINTRNLIGVWDMTASGPWRPPSELVGAQAAHPDLVLNREAIGMYTGRPQINWQNRTIASAEATYVTYPSADPLAQPWMLYQSVWTGWGIANFVPGFKASVPYDVIPESKNAFNDGKGFFVECPAGLCSTSKSLDALAGAMQIAHQKGQHFLLFVSNAGQSNQSGWFKQFRDTYNGLTARNAWQRGDIVMVINYFGSYPTLPMADSAGNPVDSSMGMLYWALQQ